MRINIYSVLLLLGACCSVVQSQSQSRNIPATISSCYQNSTAYNRYNRQPMHINNLIAIIAKIEDKKNYQWDARRVARAILKQYHFEGMSYDPDKRFGLQFETDPHEDQRAAIVDGMIASGSDTIEEGILDNDEKCALHWMLSHSINATMRDDEVSRVRFGLRAKRSANSSDDSGEVDVHYDSDDLPSQKSQRKSNESNGKQMENLASDSDYQSDSEPYNPDGLHSERLTNVPTTKQPLETGVVHTKWGPIAAGRLIAGIAAGLEPATQQVIVNSQSVYNENGNIPSFSNNNNNNGNQWNGGYNPGNNNWGTSGNGGGNSWSAGNRKYERYPQPSGSRYKRQTGSSSYLQPLSNVYAATLAGDVGQAALLNAVFSISNNVPPPTGEFNDTSCPREYIMHALPDAQGDAGHDHDTWTYMTAAEIRGGVDGLILGLKIYDWDKMYKYRLSELLRMYYSERGVSAEPRYRACNRNSVFQMTINPTDILEQSKTFTYLYNNKTQILTVSTAENIQKLYELVTDAYQKMQGYASSMGAMDPPCVVRENSASDIPDSEKQVIPRYTVFAVLDHTDTQDPDLSQQKRFVANLAYELNVSPQGSRVGLVNGATGQILIKPNWTDNAAVLACRILGERTFTQTQVGVASALGSVKAELDRMRTDEMRTNYMDNNGIIILVLNQGKKFDDSLRYDVRNQVNEFEQRLGDVHVMYASSKYQPGDYQNFVLNEQYDVIRIQTSGNLSNSAATFAQELIKKNHGRLTYPQCNANAYDQSRENTIGIDLLIDSNTIEYYRISPDYFFSAKNLRLRFSSENGKVRVCVSRWNRFPSSLNSGEGGIDCYETTGQYQPPGSSTADLEIPYEKPCGGDGDRDGCSPIYLSITPISVDNSVYPQCFVDKCQYSDQVKVTFSHWDMRCNSNSAVHMLASMPALFSSLFLTIFAVAKYS